MNADQLRAVLLDAMPRLESCREELRELDAAIGDGDLGITVSAGARAVSESLHNGTSWTPASVLQAAARSFATANPSTMSALVAAAVLAAAREVGDSEDIDRTTAIRIVRVATEAIARRGGAQPGDKTVLDALAPSADALEAAPVDGVAALRAMAEAARAGITATTGSQSRRGRAAWVGERTIGHPDAGATAYLRLLESLADAW